MTLKDKFRPLVWFNSGSFNVHQNKQKDENSIKCEKIADEYAIEFSEWMAKEYWLNSSSKYLKSTRTSELLEIFKKEKGYE
jgi:hypothetical protein